MLIGCEQLFVSNFVFAVVIVFLLDRVLGVSLTFLASKMTELLWRSFCSVCYLSNTWVFVSSWFWISVDRKTWYCQQNVIGYDQFLLFNNWTYIFSKKLLWFVEKPSSERDQYHVSVRRSRIISSLSVVSQSFVHRSRIISSLSVVSQSYYVKRLWITVLW